MTLEEDVELPTESNEEESSRTPLIEKIKSPPYDRKDRSKPPRGKTPVNNPWKKINVEYNQFQDAFANLLKKSQFCKSFLPFVEMGKY